jgi:toxin ParE1/3/4
MAVDVRFSAQASIELESAFVWYENQKPGLGFSFLKAAEDAIAKIKANPKRYSSARPPIRHYHLQRFPFTIFYTADDSIWIAAVWHQKRKR